MSLITYAYIYQDHMSTARYAGMTCGSLYILIWLYAQSGDHQNSHGLSLGGICCKCPTLTTRETKHFLKKLSMGKKLTMAWHTSREAVDQCTGWPIFFHQKHALRCAEFKGSLSMFIALGNCGVSPKNQLMGWFWLMISNQGLSTGWILFLCGRMDQFQSSEASGSDTQRSSATHLLMICYQWAPSRAPLATILTCWWSLYMVTPQVSMFVHGGITWDQLSSAGDSEWAICEQNMMHNNGPPTIAVDVHLSYVWRHMRN